MYVCVFVFPPFICPAAAPSRPCAYVKVRACVPLPNHRHPRNNHQPDKTRDHDASIATILFPSPLKTGGAVWILYLHYTSFLILSRALRLLLWLSDRGGGRNGTHARTFDSEGGLFLCMYIYVHQQPPNPETQSPPQKLTHTITFIQIQ